MAAEHPRDGALTTVLKGPPSHDTDRMIATEDLRDDDVPAGERESDQRPPAGAAPGVLLAPAAQTDPTSPTAPGETARINALAVVEYNAKNYPAAVDLFGRVLNLNPESDAAHCNLAVALRRASRLLEADAHLRRAIALNPNNVFAYMNLALVLTERHDIAGALACYNRILALEPNDAPAHNNAGLLLRKIGQLDQAAAAFARALALKPDDPAIRFNQLITLRDDAVLPEALACCDRMLAQHPDSSGIITNLAVSLQFVGRYDEALANYERAVALEPANHDARFNLALLLLLRGDYARGWREYDHRWSLPTARKPQFAQPEWQGEALEGQTILLHSEQGFGDTIQCLRYVPLVAARCGRVVLRLERSLVRLAASLPNQVVINPGDARVPGFDVWCSLLSLPRIFGTRADSIPAPVPYLAARQTITERWQRRLGGSPGLKVGLAWAGNAQHVNDFRRSIDLVRLRPLLETAGVTFVGLQLGPRAGDIAALPAGTIIDLSAELSDFAESAGALANLDLLIAVDTAVVHLAGALGRPAWVMLPFSPDWRWMLDREDSPWYPSLRLYRQHAPSDWDGVIARVAADLATLVAESAAV
jgi:tetratricopeptide (TPR) repeat protein